MVDNLGVKMELHNFETYISVDVETAGFNAKTDALLEVAMVIMDMDERGMLTPGPSMSANIEPFEGAFPHRIRRWAFP